jgi:hypothetical protein
MQGSAACQGKSQMPVKVGIRYLVNRNFSHIANGLTPSLSMNLLLLGFQKLDVSLYIIYIIFYKLEIISGKISHNFILCLLKLRVLLHVSIHRIKK